MNKYSDHTPVIFRKWKPRKEFGEEGGDIIALFPTHPGTNDPYTCSSYMHMGQHGSADPNLVMRATVPATPAEYANLKAELVSVGYDDLKVYQRLQYDFLRAREQELDMMNTAATRPAPKRVKARSKAKGSTPRTSVRGLR